MNEKLLCINSSQHCLTLSVAEDTQGILIRLVSLVVEPIHVDSVVQGHQGAGTNHIKDKGNPRVRKFAQQKIFCSFIPSAILNNLYILLYNSFDFLTRHFAPSITLDFLYKFQNLF